MTSNIFRQVSAKTKEVILEYAISQDAYNKLPSRIFCSNIIETKVSHENLPASDSNNNQKEVDGKKEKGKRKRGHEPESGSYKTQGQWAQERIKRKTRRTQNLGPVGTKAGQKKDQSKTTSMNPQ